MTGLVLEGGAMRGMYTAGVLDVMMEEGLAFSSITGVSAGALFGVNYLSGQKGRALRYNRRYNHDRDYMGIRPLIREGNLFSTEYAYRRVPRELDPFDNERYRAAAAVTPFWAVITNALTGEAEYRRVTDVLAEMDTLQASGSMPIVSRPVMLDGVPFLDGGISDSIPFRFPLAKGCSRIVVVLTRDADYRKKPAAALPTRLLMRKYPRIRDRMLHRHEDYNRSLEELRQLEAQGIAFVIRPSEKLVIDRLERDPEKLQQVWTVGQKDMRALLPALKDFLRQEAE